MRLLTLLTLMACAHPRMPDPVSKPGPRTSEFVRSTDGAELFTRVYLPRGEGPWPVVLIRAPYPMGPVLSGRCRILNRHGYVCATQDTRGRNRSDGEWLPFEHEPEDGRATIEWIAEQEWCDGNIGMMGESYLGATNWAVANDPPEELKTIVPIVFGTKLYGMAYQGGMWRHDILTAWMALMPSEHKFHYVGGSRRYRRALKVRPRTEMDVAAAGEELFWFRPWLGAADPEHPYWKRDIVVAAVDTPEHTTLPVFSIGGWSDAFLGSQMETWEGLATQENSVWVIGPWNHLTFVPASVRQTGLNDDVGLYPRYQQWPRLLDWYGHHLKGEPLDTPVGTVVTYSVNGGGWTAHDAWPPATVDRTWRLEPGGDAQRCAGSLGDGGAGTAAFDYDPDDPTPARGGSGVLAGSFPLWRGAKPGFIDQKRLCERRDDLLGFASDPLDADLRVVGRLRAKVAFSTTAEDTAVNVRFLEERADGRRIHVRESILALSHRDGRGLAEYTPGDVVELELETWPVDYVFEAGSRVLVEFASASFPKYEAHANTSVPWAEAVDTVTATQTIHFEGTSITLPVLQ